MHIYDGAFRENGQELLAKIRFCHPSRHTTSATSHRGLTDVEKTSCVYWDTPLATFHHTKYFELFVPEIDPKRERNTAYVYVK